MLAVVLHHGPTRLPEAPTHPHLVDLAEADAAAFAVKQPQLRFVVDDLSGRDELERTDLDRWTDRILDATSLADLFAD